jgi:murein DD-endopeptidase MepM/ murein hydrolase activator NlpD
MKFGPAATIFALLAMPAAVRAADGQAGSAIAASASDCLASTGKAEPLSRLSLLADRQSGQLIEADGALKAPEIAPVGKSAAGGDEPEPCIATAEQATSPAMSRPQAARIAMFSTLPLIASRLTSGFGMRVHPLLGAFRMHSGVDLAAPMGTPVFATFGGRVIQAGWAGGYGLSAAIEDGGGLQTRFGHMSRLAVAPGQAVRKGEIIGFVGSTGLSTGPHLHYELRYKGQAINPAPWLGSLRRSLERSR